MSSLAFAQLRQHLVGHVHIVAIPGAVGDAKGVHVGVGTQVLQLVLLVVGVDGDEHGTYFGCGIKEGQPVGHVGGPDAHVGALLHANRQQALGQIVDTLVELAPGEAQVTVTID